MAGAAVPQSDVLHVHLDPAAALEAYAHHRRRFGEEVATLDLEALQARSRCSEWSVADVLRHINDVDGWMDAIWSGCPPPFTAFDPNVTPRQWVEAGRAIPDAEVRDRFAIATPTRAAAVSESTVERWGLPSLSPLGAVPWWMSALHVFFDSWVHERDVLLPLGIEPPAVDDETGPVATYLVGVAATFASRPVATVIAGVRVTVGDGPPAVMPEAGVDLDETEVATIIDALCGRGSLNAALAGYHATVIEQYGMLAQLLND